MVLLCFMCLLTLPPAFFLEQYLKLWWLHVFKEGKLFLFLQIFMDRCFYSDFFFFLMECVHKLMGSWQSWQSHSPFWLCTTWVVSAQTHWHVNRVPAASSACARISVMSPAGLPGVHAFKQFQSLMLFALTLCPPFPCPKFSRKGKEGMISCSTGSHAQLLLSWSPWAVSTAAYPFFCC